MGYVRSAVIPMLLAAASLTAQVPDGKSLSGKYFFREMAFASDSGQTSSFSGTLAFDGNGGYTFQGQQLTGNGGPTTASGSGTYIVSSNATFVLSPDPLRTASGMNGRIGTGALVASNTETSGTLFDLLIAIPAPAGGVSSVTLNGTYWLATLELPSGAAANVRGAFAQMTADGRDGLGNIAISGEIANTGQVSQMAAGSTYSLNADGSGSMNFPAPASTNASGLALSGTKSIYVSNDGNIFIGGGTTAGAHGIMVGIKAAVSPSNSTLSGIYFGGGINISTQSDSSFVGAVNLPGNSNAVWSRRYLQSGNGKPLNVSALNNYSISSGASGFMLQDSLAVGVNGNFFIESGVQPLVSGGNFDLIFGVKAPPLAGSGVFLNPLGVFNAASYAVGFPISQGELITLYGTGFPTQTTVADKLPLTSTLAGVQVLVNGTAAPMLAVTSDHVSAIVPYGITGATATVAVTNGGKQSNVVTMPVAATAPGVFSLTSDGLGPGAILHTDYSVVTTCSPARRGEIVQIFLTGLGAVNPPVAVGVAAPSNPLSVVTGPVAVFINGAQAIITYQGLAPTLAALYQVNVVVPLTAAGGSLPLAIQTADGFTDIANIPVLP